MLVSLCGALVSLCGPLVSLCGALVSLCGALVSLCGPLVSLCGTLVSLCGCLDLTRLPLFPTRLPFILTRLHLVPTRPPLFPTRLLLIPTRLPLILTRLSKSPLQQSRFQQNKTPLARYTHLAKGVSIPPIYPAPSWRCFGLILRNHDRKLFRIALFLFAYLRHLPFVSLPLLLTGKSVHMPLPRLAMR